MRKTFLNTLVELARKDERVYLITPDIGYSVLEPFRDEFPDRYLNVGVAEQNAIGIASGLALSGMIPYVYTIMPFVTMRPYEQIRVDVAYMNTNVRIVGVGAGFSYGSAGATHHAIEDIAIMRCLPNMTVVCPGDPWETREAVLASLNHVGPLYMRLGKQGEPIINKRNAKFRIGKAIEIIRGKDFHLITTSNTLELGYQVIQLIARYGKKGGLISMHTIKPLDIKLINRLLTDGKPIFTLEEHSLIGGLGSAVAEIAAESSFHGLFKRFGLKDEFSHFVGDHNFIRDKFKLSIDSISKNIIVLIKSV